MPSPASLPRPLKIPLHWVLVIPFVLQTVGAVGLVGYFSYRSGQRAIQTLAYQLLNEVSERVCDRLESYAQSPDMTLSDLTTFLNQSNFSPSGQVLIIERSGQLIAASPLNPPPAALQIRGMERFPAESDREARMRQGRQQLLEQLNALDYGQQPQQFMVAGDYLREGVVSHLPSTAAWFDQTRQFVHVTPFRNGSEQPGRDLDWVILIVVPEADFTGEIYRNLWRTVLLCLLTLGGTTAAGILTAYYLARPIQRLSQASQSLAAGVWPPPFQNDSPILELSVLTQSFNRTADQLQRSFDYINTALRESQEKFTKIFRSSPDPISIIALPEGRILEVNDSWLELTGLSYGEVIGHTVDTLPLELSIHEVLQQLKSARSLRNLEFHWRTSSGEVRTVLLSCEVIELEGQPCLLSISKAIDVQKRVEVALRESESRLAMAQQVAHVGSWEWDLITQKRIWSEESFRIFGLDPTQGEPNTGELLALVHPVDRERWTTHVEHLIQTATPGSLEYRIVRSSGAIRYIESRDEVMCDEQGRVIKLFGALLDITERKQLELALKASETRLREVLNGAIAAITSLQVYRDGTWSINHISAGCEVISGYSPEELVANPPLWVARILPEDWAAVGSEILSDIFAERPGTYEYRFRCKDGTLRWFSQTNQSQQDETQTFWMVTAVTSDITERKHIEAALRQSQERFQEIAHTVNQFFFVQSIETGEYLYVSPAYEKIWGHSCQSLYDNPESWFETIYPEDREWVLATLQEQRYQPMVHAEYRIVRPDGQIRWIAVDISTVKDKAGHPIRWIGLAEDMTERQQTEFALNQALQHINTHFEDSPFAIIEWDKDRRVLRWSKQAERTFGWTMDEVKSLSWEEWEFIYKEDRDRVKHEMAPLLDGLIPNTVIQNRNYTRTGQVILCEWYISAVFDETGNLASLLSFVKDITAQEQAQLELRQQKELRETIYNESTDAIFLVEPETRIILDCNRRAVELFETSDKTDLLGISGTTLHRTPQTPEEAQELLTEMEQKGFCSREIEYITQQGNSFWGNLAAKIVSIAGQRINLVRITDIRDRKKTEEALNFNAELFRQIVENTRDGLYIYCLESQQYIYRNSVYQTLWQRDLDALTEDSLRFQWIYPDDRPLVLMAYHQEEEGQPTDIEFRIVLPNGQLRWVHNRVYPVYNLQGKLTRLAGILEDITERKQAEQALQASEARTRAILTAIPDIITLLSADGIYLDSMRTNTVTDLVPEAMNPIGQHISKLLPPEIATSHLGAIQQALATNQPQIYEQQIQVGDRLQYEEVRIVACGQNAALIIIRDISDRKRAEEALRQSEATNRALLQAIPDLLIHLHRDGTYLDVKPTSVFPMLAQASQLIGSQIQYFLPASLAQERLEAVARALDTREIQTYEFPLVIDQQTRWQEARIIPLGVHDVLVVIRDLTDRRQTEEALRQSEELFRRAFDDAAVGMSLIGLDGRFLKVNRSLCEILGYNEAELLERTVKDISHPDDLEIDQEHIQKALAGKKLTYQLEKRNIHKQGYVVWILLSVSLVRDRNDQPLYFVSQVQDISDRHKLDRIKNEFISIVSHELRTPLTAIRGSLGILETGVLDEEPVTAKRMLQVALSNSERLVRLVNDILDLERLQSGKTRFVMEACKVGDLLQQAVESVQAIAAQSSITIHLSIPSADVWAAPDAIVQTLTNLMANAIKFSPEHSNIWLTAQLTPYQGSAPFPGETSAFPSSSPSSYVVFAIRDQGRGIPADKLESIFGRFQQVDVSDARQKGGTGLGLAICKSIVQQHNGQIWVESELGAGSTFYFTIPTPDHPDFS